MKKYNEYRDNIVNFFLRLRYKWFRKYVKPLKLGTPEWEADFTNDNFRRHEGDDRGQVVSLKENVKIVNGELHLSVTPYNKIYSGWWGEKYFKWSRGGIDYANVFERVYGTWTTKLNIPYDSSPAFWFMRKEHYNDISLFKYTIDKIEDNVIYVNEPIFDPIYHKVLIDNGKVIAKIKDYNLEENSIILEEPLIGYNKLFIYSNKHHIIPEVDVIEVIHKKIKHTIHYGYTQDGYRREDFGPYVVIPEFREYEFGVTISDKGYKFYTDGILTGVITIPETISPEPCYPIFSIKLPDEATDESLERVMIVKYLKYYK